MRIKISVRHLDRLWTGLLALAFVIAMRDAAIGAGPIGMSEADAAYHAAWLQVASVYVDPTFNGQDWATWEHKFEGRLKSVDEAREAIKTMVASLGDRFTRVAQVVSEPAPGEQPPQADAQAASAPSMPSAPGTTSTGTSGDRSSTTTAATNSAPAEAVTYKQLGDIGYIKISSFQPYTVVRQFKNSLRSLESSKQLILDLRGNRGGAVNSALEIADVLLDSGDIMSTVSREGRKTMSVTGWPMCSTPMVVLVDGNTASAAEILTGALHDNHRAQVIGSKTYGKGLIQDVTNLPGNLILYVTSAHYATPNGTDINGKGIEPDIKPADKADALQTAIEYLQTHS